MIKHDYRRPEMLFGQKPFVFRLQAQAIRDGILKAPAGGVENGDRIGVGQSLERVSRCTKLGDLENKEWFVVVNWETQHTHCT